MKYILRDEHQRAIALDDLRTAALPARMELEDARGRSLDQNSLQHMWYGEIAEQRGDCNADDVKAECKLFFGVRILRRDDEVFDQFYRESVKPRDYEWKLKAVRFLVSTRDFSKSQAREYMDAMQEWARERGWRLTDPDEPAVMRGAA